MFHPRNEASPGNPNHRDPGHRAPSGGRFWIGVAIFIAVALAYPFYSFEVQTRLAARSLAEAAPPVSPPTATPPPDQLTAAEQRQADIAAREANQPIPVPAPKGVTVYGTTITAGDRVVVAELAGQSLEEAKASLCKQAAALYRAPLTGETLRIQRHGGAEPAVDVGKLVCD